MWLILSDSINYNVHLQQHSNLLHFAFHRQSSTLENIDSVLLSRSIRVHLKSGLGRTRTSGLNWLGASSNLILKRKDAVSLGVYRAGLYGDVCVFWFELLNCLCKLELLNFAMDS